MNPESRIILAADLWSLDYYLQMPADLISRFYGIKLNVLAAPEAPRLLSKAGWRRIWVGLNYYYTPDTIKSVVKSCVDAGANIITVSALAGTESMRVAVEVAHAAGAKVYALTLLTSMKDDEVKRIFKDSATGVSLTLAELAEEAGVDGIMFSPEEIQLLRQVVRGTELIVPGIRMPGTDQNDQRRVGTPRKAMADGADYLVIGRPITGAADPKAALDAIELDVARGIADRGRGK